MVLSSISQQLGKLVYGMIFSNNCWEIWLVMFLWNLFFLVYLNEADYENYETTTYKDMILIRFVINIDKIGLCLPVELVEVTRKQETLKLESHPCILWMTMLIGLVFFWNNLFWLMRLTLQCMPLITQPYFREPKFIKFIGF